MLEAPDDADVKSVVSGYRRAQLRAQNPAEYDPESKEFGAKYGPLARGTRKVPIRGVGMVEQPEDDVFTEGIGSGMVRMGRGIGNIQNKLMNAHPLAKAIGGINLPNSEAFSDEALKAQDELDRPIAQTGKGAAGQLLGQTAVAYGATAPIGAAKPLSTALGRVGRALAYPTSRAALEGGIAGAGAADPDEQGEGALKGAVLSATIERILGLGGRAIKGLVTKSEDTRALQQLAAQQGEEVFVPISQAASEDNIPSKLARIAYAEGLSLVPGVRGQLTRQAEGAAEKVRELAIKEATPEGTFLPNRPGHNVQESLASIRQGFDESYGETVKALDFQIPKDLRTRLASQIKKEAPDIDAESADKAMMLARGLLRRFSNESPKIEGSGLLIVREQLRKAAEKAPDFERPAFVAVGNAIDDIIKQRLQVQGLWQKFADLEEPARHLRGLEGAADAARAQSGRFSPAQLARKAEDATQLDLAQTAAGAMKGSPAGTSFAGRSLLSGAATMGGMAAEPVTASTVLIASNLLATKTAQKALMGDTAAQKAITELLEKHPDAAEAVERALRQAAATEAGE